MSYLKFPLPENFFHHNQIRMERKERLRSYASQRAYDSETLLQEFGPVSWKFNTKKHGILTSKSIDTSYGHTKYAARAVVPIHTDMLTVATMLQDMALHTSTFRKMMSQIWRDRYLDAIIIQSLDEPISPFHLPRDQFTCMKWWALKSTGIHRKPKDYCVVEHLSIERDNQTDIINGCTLFQESIEDLKSQEELSPLHLERDKINCCIIRFEESSDPKYIRCIVVIQRDPHVLGFLGYHPVLTFANTIAMGIRNMLETTWINHSHLKDETKWVLDSERSMCSLCNRKFGLLIHRHHCRSCGEIICRHCSNFMVLTDKCSSEACVRFCAKCILELRKSKNNQKSYYHDSIRSQFISDPGNHLHSTSPLSPASISYPYRLSSSSSSSPSQYSLF